MLLYLIVKTTIFLISLPVINKSSVTFSKNNPQKTSLTIRISGQIYYPNVGTISFPLFFFPEVTCYTYQVKKDVLQEAVLFWNPLGRIHSPKYTAIQDIKYRSKPSARQQSLCTLLSHICNGIQKAIQIAYND